MIETFGPECVRPAQRDCPRCTCCTAVLCERGRTSIRRCYGLTSEETRTAVEFCPCSAASTRHTASWRMEQVRATRLARELPLAHDVEELLRAMAAGARVEDPDELFPQLKLRGLAQLVHGLPAITPLGHTYLAARDDVRSPTGVRVVDVDLKARTVQVEVPAWRPDETVTVLLDQVLVDTGFPDDMLSGRWFEAEANYETSDADRLVLTSFRATGVPAPVSADEAT
ncbi:hypothetical protein [Streptomyces sp. NE06-03C]|uniref:hypothetical protein n=1 Tax=Streptomyces sp. NE06-03C TaxID=3028694 RepID=UPI0029B0CB71|nr:hypothetical protein [Streptomyces sp. NE06-03C]MDX2919690.1 hypothetical protein [Streptomyces sp. NE06-03C]